MELFFTNLAQQKGFFEYQLHGLDLACIGRVSFTALAPLLQQQGPTVQQLCTTVRSASLKCKANLVIGKHLGTRSY